MLKPWGWVRVVYIAGATALLVAFLTACGGGDEDQGEHPDTARPASACNERPEACR